MQNLNLKQLEVFVAVVECGSFTTAAEQIYLAQSTVSGHVAALEKELNLTLLIRTGKRKLMLTDEGRKVYAHAKTILQNCADLSRELVEHTSLELTLAASTIPMQYVLPRYLAGFSNLHDQYRFTLRGGDSETVHEMVLSGRAQLGFVGAVLNRQELQYEPLETDELVLITPDTERFRQLQQSGAVGNDLLNEPLIFREGGSGTKLAVDRFLCENEIPSQQIQIIARMEDTQAMVEAVRLGMGMAIVSGLAAEAAPQVLQFPLRGKSTARQLYMIHAKGYRLTKPAQAFHDYILQQLETPAAEAEAACE